jgi:serine/threonine protein kinase
MQTEDLQLDHLKANCDERFQALTENSKGCDWIPISGKILGQGKYGCTFQVCCNGDCNFIVKNVNVESSSAAAKIIQEVQMQKLFGKAAPELVDAFICDDNAYIVMEKKDMTIEGFVNLMKSMGKSTAEIIKQIDNIEAEVKQLVRTTHKMGLLHGDLHRENIMLNILKDERGMPVAWSNIQLIDFGKSKQLAENHPDLKEEAEGLKMTFSLLRNFAKEPISKGPPVLKNKSMAKCGLPTKKVTQSFFSPEVVPASPKTPRTPPRGSRLFFDEEEEEEFKPRGNLFGDDE